MTHFGEGRGVIRLGDTTTHGGEVISASGFPDMGKRIACVGDMVKCPKCKGTFPIVEGDDNKTYMNKPMAYHGDKTACGAALISSWGVIGLTGSNSMPHLTPESPVKEEVEAGDRYFIVHDREGNPLSNVGYVITGADGKQYSGRTDDSGHTTVLQDTLGLLISVEIFGEHFSGDTTA